MFSNSVWRDDENGGDLSRCMAGSDQAEDFRLALRQTCRHLLLLTPPFCACLHLDQGRAQEFEERSLSFREVPLAAFEVDDPCVAGWGREPDAEAVVDARWLPDVPVKVQLP